MTQKIQLRRGLRTALPTTGLAVGEPLFSTDRLTLHAATDATTAAPLTPAIDELTTLASIDGAADFVLLHDASSTGQKEKKMTFSSFKSALNIPAASTDEKVAAVSNGTSGFLWGTDGTDGVLRAADSTLDYTLDTGSAFVSFGLADDAVTTAKLANTALNINSTTFSGTGVDTELDVAVIDGGAF